MTITITIIINNYHQYHDRHDHDDPSIFEPSVRLNSSTNITQKSSSKAFFRGEKNLRTSWETKKTAWENSIKCAVLIFFGQFLDTRFFIAPWLTILFIGNPFIIDPSRSRLDRSHHRSREWTWFFGNQNMLRLGASRKKVCLGTTWLSPCWKIFLIASRI